jgi:hypothetical protein
LGPHTGMKEEPRVVLAVAGDALDGLLLLPCGTPQSGYSGSPLPSWRRVANLGLTMAGAAAGGNFRSDASSMGAYGSQGGGPGQVDDVDSGEVALAWMLASASAAWAASRWQVLVQRDDLSSVAHARSEVCLSYVRSVTSSGRVTVGWGSRVTGRNPWPVGHDGGDACGHHSFAGGTVEVPLHFHYLYARVKTQFLLEWMATTPSVWPCGVLLEGAVLGKGGSDLSVHPVAPFFDSPARVPFLVCVVVPSWYRRACVRPGELSSTVVVLASWWAGLVSALSSAPDFRSSSRVSGSGRWYGTLQSRARQQALPSALEMDHVTKAEWFPLIMLIIISFQFQWIPEPLFCKRIS